MLVILNVYFGESLYCDDLNSNLNTNPELREDNTQVDSIFNVDQLHVLHSWLGFYKNYKAKRIIYWYLWKQDTNQFHDYKEFKESWDPHIKIGQEIKKYVKEELDKLVRVKRTVGWFTNPGRLETRENKKKFFFHNYLMEIVNVQVVFRINRLLMCIVYR